MDLFLKKKGRTFINGQHFFFSSDSNQNYIGFTPLKKKSKLLSLVLYTTLFYLCVRRGLANSLHRVWTFLRALTKYARHDVLTMNTIRNCNERPHDRPITIIHPSFISRQSDQKEILRWQSDLAINGVWSANLIKMGVVTNFSK